MNRKYKPGGIFVIFEFSIVFMIFHIFFTKKKSSCNYMNYWTFPTYHHSSDCVSNSSNCFLKKYVTLGFPITNYIILNNVFWHNNSSKKEQGTWFVSNLSITGVESKDFVSIIDYETRYDDLAMTKFTLIKYYLEIMKYKWFPIQSPQIV